MKRFWTGLAVMAALSACGDGNPFTDGLATGPGATPENPDIPQDLVGDLAGVTYVPDGAAPGSGTLLVRGVALDGTPFETAYTRKPALDRGGYEAYTAQANGNSQHYTAYAKTFDGTSGTVVVSGGQFGYYFGGTTYSRSGNFDPPTGGAVSYTGNYVGLLNIDGDGGDLLPTTLPPAARSGQAAEVTGRVVVNADFTDNRIQGRVFDRLQEGATPLESLDFEPNAIADNGTFTGKVTQGPGNDRGTYGGIFGGTDLSAVAGSLRVQDHIDGVNNEEEYGLFVLGQCGSGNEDPSLCP